MTLRALLALAALALPPAATAGQPAAEPAGVPRGEAKLFGRVVHAERGPAAGVEVLLYALPANAPPGVRKTTSGSDGRFAFQAIDHDPGTTYLVGARYQEISYPGARVQFASGEREREVEVRIHDATEDPERAVFRELRMRLDWTGARLEVTEDLTVENADPKTVFVAQERRAGRAPAVEVGLPAGAASLAGPLGLLPEGVELGNGTLRWFGPVYPGGAELGYHYQLPAPAGVLRLERKLSASPIGVRVLAPAGGPPLRASGLVEGAPTVVEGRGYRVFAGELGGTLALELDVPAARHDPSALSVAEVRLLGELDAAAYEGREEHVLLVRGDGPLLAEGETPLVTIPLPTGATELRFGTPQSATRLVPLPDGSGIGVLGPLAPGETVLEVRYRLPAGSGVFALTRHFDARVPLLSVYIADTGNLRISSDRLHRRRTARSPDRSYLHLEAFELAPGEPASFSIATRPPRRDLPRAAVIGAVALATGLAAFALAAPLRRAPTGLVLDPLEVESAAERETEAIGAALEELEHDFETGKLDAAGHAELRADLTAALERGLAGLAAGVRDAPGPGALAAVTPPHCCPACGKQAFREWRFCAHCGAGLA